MWLNILLQLCSFKIYKSMKRVQRVICMLLNFSRVTLVCLKNLGKIKGKPYFSKIKTLPTLIIITHIFIAFSKQSGVASVVF